MVLSSIFEFMGLSLIYPFLDIIFDLNSFPSEYFVKINEILKSYSIAGSNLVIGTLIIILIFFKGLVTAFYRYYLNLIVHNWIIQYRLESYSKIFNSKIEFISENISRINNSITKQIEIAGGVFNTKFNILQTILNSSILLILGFLISIEGFFFAVIFGLILFFLFKITYKYSKLLGKRFTEYNQNYFNIINEILGNFNYLKTTNSYKKFNESMTLQVKNISKSLVRFGLLTHTTKALTEPIILFSLIIIFFININFFNNNLASIILMYAVLIKIFANVLSLVQRYQEYNNDMASVSYFENFYKDLIKSQENEIDGNKIDQIEEIKLDDVEVSIEKKKLLKIEDLRISKGKTFLFFGKSGSGKTTLIKAILGLHDDYTGKILINNMNVKKINLAYFREKIGYVSQEISTFNLSLRENIRFRNQNVTDEKIIELIKKFNLEGIFPENKINLDLKVNEMKTNLSGGERQRISFIREIVLNPEILIFDEATSSLDSENVERFINYINKNKKETAVIIISHQKNYFDQCDEVYEIIDKKLQKVK